MQNNTKRQYIYLTLTIITICTAFILAYIPLYNTKILERKLISHKKNQIQYINQNIQIVPELINLIKGYIIHNETALKDIIQINILTKTPNKDLNQIYDNQLKILNLTNNLITNANKISLLSKNEKFIETKNKFSILYDISIKGYIDCKIYSNKLQKYTRLPIYKNFVNKEINKFMCFNK